MIVFAHSNIPTFKGDYRQRSVAEGPAMICDDEGFPRRLRPGFALVQTHDDDGDLLEDFYYDLRPIEGHWMLFLAWCQLRFRGSAYSVHFGEDA